MKTINDKRGVENLIDQYENLRQLVLVKANKTKEAELFIQRGMTSWIEVNMDINRVSKPKEINKKLIDVKSDNNIPNELYKNATGILAEMAFKCIQGMAI